MALDFFAGCVGGCAGVIIGHPLDTVKVRIQTQDFRNPIYRGTWHCFTTIAKQESIRGLYKGVSSPMAGVALVNAVVFGVYGNVQRRMGDSQNLTSHFLAGACAGFSQSFICSPMELAKTRLQVQKTAIYKGSLDCLVQTARQEGTRGVFKGLGVTITREIPAFGTYFLTYELLTGGREVGTGTMLMAGGLAGAASWIVSYPIDVVKSRLQCDGLGENPRYSGAVDCLRKSIASEGYTCLFRGLNSTIIRAFPTNAVTFATVTWVFRLAGASSKPVEDEKPKIYTDREPICTKLKKNFQPAEFL